MKSPLIFASASVPYFEMKLSPGSFTTLLVKSGFLPICNAKEILPKSLTLMYGLSLFLRNRFEFFDMSSFCSFLILTSHVSARGLDILDPGLNGSPETVISRQVQTMVPNTSTESLHPPGKHLDRDVTSERKSYMELQPPVIRRFRESCTAEHGCTVRLVSSAKKG
jgi:hypothetical protein